jgi:hypothetical protein
MTEKSVYIVDASSLIELEKLVTKDFFLPLFSSLESLISSGGLISHEEVLQELIRKDGTDGDICKWARKQNNLFIKLDIDQIETARKILQKFQNLIDPDKKNNADPFLIALAIINKQQKLMQAKYTIVTEEVPSNNVSKPKIPDVCNHYKIEYLNLNDFLKKELEIKIEFKNNHSK